MNFIEESGPEIEAAASFTLQNLDLNFKDSLNPELIAWRKQFEDGTYEVACAGPGGSC